MNTITEPTSGLTYAQAGVDIDAGNRFVDQIKPLIRSTRRPGVLSDTDDGGFAGVIDLGQTGIDGLAGKIVLCNDGVGTKLLLALAMGKLDTVGIDCVAMCVNDLICQGAVPLAFLDYYGVGKLDPALGVEIVEGIAEGCRQAGCALIGGETAELPGIYEGDRFDLVGSAMGAIDPRLAFSPVPIKPDDSVIGLRSSGIHSNGLSLVRKIVDNSNLAFDKPEYDLLNGERLGDVLLTPTRIYVREVLAALATGKVKAIAHITGGGLIDNPPRILPAGLSIDFDDVNRMKLPFIFCLLAKKGGVENHEMLRTFNCGIGMIMITDATDEADVLWAIRQVTGPQQGRGDRRVGRVKIQAGDERVTFVD